MAFPSVENLTRLIEPVAAAYGMDVEGVRAVPAGKKSQVVVALASDTRPSLDELEQVSNELSALFDAQEDAGEMNFGAGYTLEVTTPGVDLPLTAPRHWRRNRGRAVVLGEQKYRIGALDPAEEGVILIPSGAKNPRPEVHAVSSVGRAVVDIEFSTPSAAEMELADLTFDEAAQRAAE